MASIFHRCFTAIWLFIKLFKRRVLSIFGFGQKKAQDPPLLPTRQEQKYTGGCSDERWEDWSQDAKQELTAVAVVKQEDIIEERKIENLFAGMTPVVQPTKPAAAPTLGLRRMAAPATTSVASKFSFSEVALKVRFLKLTAVAYTLPRFVLLICRLYPTTIRVAYNV